MATVLFGALDYMIRAVCAEGNEVELLLNPSGPHSDSQDLSIHGSVTVPSTRSQYWAPKPMGQGQLSE